MINEKAGAKVRASCRCPYCEEEVISSPICMACGVVIHYCASCEAPLKKDATICQVCGQKV